MRTIVVGISLLLTLTSSFVMLWSVVPAPLYHLFMLSVAAGEWSLWFGAIALIGACMGGWAIALGTPRLGNISLICGLLAVVLAVKPPLQAIRVAAQASVPLSLTRYLFGAEISDKHIEETRNVVYAEVRGQALRLDIYRPRPSSRVDTAPLPAVIIIHGGSWSGGSKGEFKATSRTVARDGAVAFDIEYRLASPTVPFPAQIADVKCAIGWVKDNAQTYGVDPQRIALVGRSAGGQLALLAAYAADNQRLPPSCSVGDTAVQAVVSFYAPVDLLWGYHNPLRPDVVNSQATLRNYLGGSPATVRELYELASPTSHVTSSSPPTFIIHGGFDSIVGVRHAQFMAAALQENHVPHQLLILPWANHGFDFASNGWGTQITESLIRDFLEMHL